VKWNKRGNTGGGASSGSGGTKRGGSARTPISGGVDRGVLTCPRCLGEKQIGNPATESDEDGDFTGEDLQECPRCRGKGTVTAT
jgi:hypothetical protein